MWFKRMLIEKESPELFGYERIKYNLTESSTTDKSLKDLNVHLDEDMLLCYGDHYGNAKLRSLIAQCYGVEADDVNVTVGSCMALFIVYSTLLKPGERMLVMHPNYPADIDIARSLGFQVDLYHLQFNEGFRLDADKFISMLQPDTKLASITYPHNPTGSMVTAAEIKKIYDACAKNGTYLLMDETYGDLTVGERLPHACNFGPYGICVESLSKAIGAPGIRCGWIVTRNQELQEALVSAKEQICICGSVVDEEIACQIMQQREELMAKIRADIDEKFAIVCEELDNQDVLEWVRPSGGVICFPHIKDEIQLDTAEFYDILNNKYGVFVGPGRWFDMDDRYFRVGYAWPDKEQLRAGLKGLIAAVQDARKN